VGRGGIGDWMKNNQRTWRWCDLGTSVMAHRRDDRPADRSPASAGLPQEKAACLLNEHTRQARNRRLVNLLFQEPGLVICQAKTTLREIS
jgi:hypothetical protein